MQNKLYKSIRHIFAQFGGGGPSFNMNAPGSVNFGTTNTGMGNNQSSYYEYPLDASIKRINDPTLNDPELSIEKRLEIYHNDFENDLKNTFLKDNEINELHRSDNKLRKTKIITEIHLPKDEPIQHIPEYVSFEALLNAARSNSTEKHPYEDINPPTIKPTRRHTVISQLYTNRGTGTSVFNPTTEGERSPFNQSRYTSPPDGNPRSYPYRNQNEIDNYLKNPEDINFEHLYGASLTFDFPQDPERAENTGFKGVYGLFKKFLQKMKSNPMSHEQALEEWQEELRKNLLNGGGGKGRRLDQWLGDTRDFLQEPMGVADKYPASPISADGGSVMPVSSR